MYKPNYEDYNIVNLMSSLAKSYDKNNPYSELSILKNEDLKKYDNIILVIIDGLGYNYLMKKETSFLKKKVIAKLQSAFPATTPCSNSVFDYGLPVQQHGITGWFMNSKEAAMIITPLPFMSKFYGERLDKQGFNYKNLVNCDAFTKDLSVNCYYLINEEYSDSSATKCITEGAEVIGIKPLENTFEKIKEILKNDSHHKFIHAYVDTLDHDAHDYGINSEICNNIFDRLDNQIKDVVNNIENTNTALIITADHGLTDVPSSHVLWLEDYPDIEKCLTIPFSGDSRFKHCYVRPSKVNDFEKLVKEQLSDYCTMVKGEDMIKDHWFGLFEEHPHLFDRVGDYILLMKDDYIFLDRTLNQLDRGYNISNHSGTSEDEIYVPLILIKG